VVRHTRADEEAGGRAGGLGRGGSAGPADRRARRAAAASAVLTVLLLAALLFLACPPPARPSSRWSSPPAGWPSRLAAVAAQLAAGARAARGMAIGVLGAAYLLRAVGDAGGASGPGWLTWLSPLGWTELARPTPKTGGGCWPCRWR